MTRSAKIFLSVTTVLVALIGAIGLSSLALYYVVSIREANELVIEGYLAAAAGDYDVAIAQYSAALQKPMWNQQKALLYTNRGFAYNSKKQFADAIADHTAAIRLNPQLSYAFAARGYAYVERGELEKGLVDLTESIRLDPNSDSAYYNRGLLLDRRGEFSDALTDFDEAVRCSPERADDSSPELCAMPRWMISIARLRVLMGQSQRNRATRLDILPDRISTPAEVTPTNNSATISRRFV